MSRSPSIPENCRLKRGYLECRVRLRGNTYFKHFGKDCLEARVKAADWVHATKQAIRLTKLGYQEAPISVGFSYACDIFYKYWYEKETRSHASLKNAASMLRLLKAHFKDQPLDSFTAEHIKEWRRVSEKTAKFSTINRRQSILNSLFQRFNYWNLLGASSPIKPVKLPKPSYNPVALIRKPSELGEARQRVVTLDELKRLRAACEALGDGLLWKGIYSAIHTMLRRADLITVEPGADIRLFMGKTKKKIVLPIVMDQKIDPVNIRKRWERVRRLAGCTGLQWRDFRRSGSSLLKQFGYSQALIKDALGHANQKTTDLYLNVPGRELEPALADIARFLDNV